MAIILPTLPGLTPSAVHNIPGSWSASWYHRHIRDFLQWADVRNSKVANGITISGNLTGPATIGIGPTLLLTGQTVTTTSPAAGGAGALPATPAGYLKVFINGVNRVVAFY